jgi:hypothetical protein
LGWVSAVDCQGRTIWIVDAHSGDGNRFVVRADEKRTAFLELAIRSTEPGKSLLDYVIRQFHLIFGTAESSGAPDLR